MAGEYALINEIQTDWYAHDDTWKVGVDKNWKIIDWTSRKYIKSVEPTPATIPPTPLNGEAFLVLSLNQVWVWNSVTTQFDKINLLKPIIFYDETLLGWYQWIAGVVSPLLGAAGVLSVTGYWVDNTDPSNPIVTAPKKNIDIISPTITDDDTQDYSVNSTWFNSVTGAYYICEDASTGAAVWTLLNSPSVLNYVVSASSGGSISPASGTGPVTNFSESFTTNGNPVEIRVIPDGSSNEATFGTQNTGPDQIEFNVIYKRDGTIFAKQRFRIAAENPTGSDLGSFVGTGAAYAMDFAVVGLPGTYVYSIEMEDVTSPGFGRFLWSKMVVKEL